MDILLPDEASMLQYGTDLLDTATKFLLYGELGAGKTTIAKGIAQGIGIDPQEIQSPTYTYLHIYAEKLLHIDMRRIETEEQLVTLGILDLIDQYERVVIERPKREKNYSDASRQSIHLRHAHTGRQATQAKNSLSQMYP